MLAKLAQRQSSFREIGPADDCANPFNALARQMQNESSRQGR
jgi:hypothetical protein